jgi:hypothetical protein
MRTGDSGMVHLNELTSSPAIEPEIIAAVPATASSTAGVLLEQARVDRPVSSRPAPTKRRGMSWLLVAGAVVLAGAATAGVAASKGMTARDAAQRIMAVFRPSPAVTPVTPFQPNQENAAPVVAAVARPGPAQPAAAPPANATEQAAAPAAAKQPVAAAHQVATKTDKTPAPQPKVAEVVAPVVPAKQTTAPANPLANAMEKAAGSRTSGNDVPPPRAQVDTGPSDVAEIPPQGAILGALGAKRQAAKACVRGMDGPSRATLVFASTGQVKSVTISGAAAGTSAEVCLKSVFAKVSVDPFSRATYTSSTTITP